MEEETEDRDCREDFLATNFGLARNVKIQKSNYVEEDSDGLKENTDNFKAKNNLSNDGQDSGSSKSNSDSDINHLSALANLDPSCRFEENASLIKDIRLAARVSAEEEVNKVFMCHLCGFKTAYANSLMNHQAVHSDFRPWVCTACEYAAKRKQDLKKHLHTVHGMMVESPMLKPLVPTELGNKFWGNENQYGDCTNSNSLKRSSSLDQDSAQGQSSPPPSSGFPPSKKLREEEAINAFTNSYPLSLSSNKPNVFPAGDLDSPEDNLPISFPALSSSSPMKHSEERRRSESPPLPKYLPGREEGEIVFSGAHPNFAWQSNSNRRERYPDPSSVNIPRDWASRSIKKENDFHTAGFALKESRHPSLPVVKSARSSRREGSLQGSFSLSDEETSSGKAHIGVAETDRSITSSSVVAHGRSTQTPTGFLCEHCDILFFQRAMYVMHIGLHAPDNPWCCAVCGNTFTEKYSFTSHFINQH